MTEVQSKEYRTGDSNQDYLTQEEMLINRLLEEEELPKEKHFNLREATNIKHKKPKWLKDRR